MDDQKLDSDGVSPITLISAKNPPLTEVLQEFWHYRELLYMLTLRRISVRYKQTLVGVTWVLLQPLVAMIIFNIIFGKLIKIPTAGVPYPIFVYAALVLWTLFAEGVNRASGSLIGESQLISKVYFPRLMIPIAAVASAWIDFVVSLFLLLPLTFIYGLRPTWSLGLIPVLMVVTMVLATGIGLFFGALNVRYRDFQYLVPFLMQILFFASPVIFSVEIVPPQFQKWYYLNPMAAVIDGFRFAVTGITPLSGWALAWSMVCGVIFLGLGVLTFQAVEREFADVI
ncbi:ABC transporter permease [Thermosynechococcaceae cyanobacterium BACA0444]|uniref:Transport permease protein n=1 Tax=Pseudocalidococcus azoricus BACA0444 TaxID=2918990 RepID=A0AAE4FS76_9CYAN|nr:ABC transporter permease [Pseudocalidococcus azoricus]MDS3859990.1 ABC transporter permease [Pseudocalidococcus azoricus BACA0444]